MTGCRGLGNQGLGDCRRVDWPDARAHGRARGQGVKPDMMTIAKAITSGYFRLARRWSTSDRRGLEADKTGLGSIGHGYTYSAHPVGCAAGVAALAETKRLAVNEERGAARGVELGKALEALKARHALVGGRAPPGADGGVAEVVSDRDKKTPADKATMAKLPMAPTTPA